MEQVEELHVSKLLIFQKDVLGRQIRVDHIVPMQELQKLYKFQTHVDGLNFCEESWRALSDLHISDRVRYREISNHRDGICCFVERGVSVVCC